MRMTRKQRRARQRRLQANGLKSILTKGVQLAAAAVFLWNGFAPTSLHAMPANGEVTAGSAIISQAGSVMTIQQQTAQAAINWQAFNIAANEKVHFLQPGSNAIALNRVIGNNSSAIYGQLTANGKVFLVNQNGVYFAPGAQVNVGGLVASTLSITDADFLAGKYNFVNQGGAQGVVNQGTIIANNQGLVSLLAPEVKNEGIIVAKKGSVILAAGNQATLDFAGDGKVQLALEPGALQAMVDNKGLIEADGGVVLMTARAGQDLTSSVVNQSGVIHARSLDGITGAVTLNAVDGKVQVAGKIDVSGTGTKGGAVDVFGKAITLANGANIDASGNTGGGKVRIGGDWQGTGDAPHAQTVAIDQGTVIHADALTAGNGGTVAVWSDGTTRFDGTISAKGGTVRGDGGQVETSGHVLQANGLVDASAAKGKSGEWLLDPYNVTITSSGGSGSSGTYVPSGNDSTVDVNTINGALNGGTSVTIKTGAVPGAGSTGTQDGNITVNATVTKTSGADATLTLQAHNNIIVNADITSTLNKLNVDLHADTDATSGGTITVNSGKNIITNGGSVLLHGGAGTAGYAINQINDATPGVDIQGNITTGGGAITIYGQSTASAPNAVGVSLAGALNSGGGAININGFLSNNGSDSSSASVKVNGSIDAGTGTVAISGKNDRTGGQGIALSLSSTGQVTAKNALLIGNRMTIDNSAQVTGSIGGIVTVKPLDAAKAVSIGTTDTGGLNLAGNLFSGSSVFQGFSQTVIGHEAGTGTLTVNGATFGNDVTLQAPTGAGSIAITGALNAAGHTINLKAGTSATETGGAIAAEALNLQGTNAAFTLNGANSVGTLAGNVKSVAFTNAGDFAVGTVDTTSGLTIADDSTLTASSGNVTIQKNITKTGSTTKNLTVNATPSGTITVNSGATVGAAAGKLNVNFNAGQDVVLDSGILDSKGGNVNLTAQNGKVQLTNDAQVKAGSGNIAFRSKNLAVMDGVSRGGTVTGTGTLTIDTYEAGGTIGVGDGSTGELIISTAAFGATPVFTPGFSQIAIGRADGTGTVNVGQLTVQDKLTVQSGGTGGNITFTPTADLRTANKVLLLDASTIDFGTGTAKIEAGSSDLTLRGDTINNWGHVTFDTVTGGQLFIEPKTVGRALQVGGTAAAGKLSVDSAGFAQIDAGKFTNVTIGRSDGNGGVAIDSFQLQNSPTNLTIVSPGGDATIADNADVKMTNGQALIFKVKSLTQGNAAKITANQLLLQGTGAFNLAQPGNAIGTIAANVGSLSLYNSSPLTVGTVGGVDGITATGGVTLAADRMTVNKNVRTPGELTIYTLTDTKDINVGGTDDGSNLFLQSSYFTPDSVLGGGYSSITLGRSTHNGDINITDTTFSSNLNLITQKKANVKGTVKVGSTLPYKDLTIKAQQATLPSTGNLYVHNLTFDVQDFSGLAGNVQGTGALKVNIPTGKDIFISDTYGGDQYKISYSTVNDVFHGFGSFAVVGDQNITLHDGSLNQSVALTSGGGSNGVTVDGTVGIGGTNTQVDITGGNFTVNSGKVLTVSGTNATVNVTADATNLATNAAVNVGTGNFTLKTDTLAASTGAKITGSGALTLMQKTASRALDINTTGSGSGLVITDAQLNGGLFDTTFSNLTLGNAGSSAVVKVDGVTIDNNVTIQTGATGTITIGSGTLALANNNRKVTLKGGTVTNGGNIIDAQNGTINFYANALNLTGANTVRGAGTLGLGTYDGSTAISLGNSSHGGLSLADTLFTGGGAVFGSGFNHYSIGNDSQGTIHVDNSALTKDTTLTANNITLYNDMNVGDKTLTLKGNGTVTQNGGIITADKLALLGTGKYDLTASANKIGMLAANAKQIKVKAEKLIVGDITTPGNGAVIGITASGTGISGDDTVRLETTTTDGLTVNKNISAANGNITLTADAMSFASTARVSAPGVLTVQQYNTGTTMGIGDGAAGTLQLPKNLFNDSTRVFQDGFSHIYLGRDNGTGAVEVAGALDFADPTTIRSPGTSGSITVKDNSTITTGNNSLEFKTVKLTTGEGATINTGSGTLTLTVDELNLAGSSNPALAPIQGSGELILQTLTLNKDLYLGQSGSDGLFLKAGYFDGSNSNRVFRDGYSKIIIGQAAGTGMLYQTGTTGFTDEVLIRQASGNSTGGVNVSGVINTGNNDFTVESQKVNIDAQINAGSGNVSLTADTLNITGNSRIQSTGDLSITTYSKDTNINLGGSEAGALNLQSGWFDGSNRIFEDGFHSITIGRTDGTGTMTVKDNFKVTDNLTLQSGSGKVTTVAGKTLDLSGNNLTVTTTNGAIDVPSTVKNVNTLTVTTNNTVSFTNEGNTIANIGNITAGKGIEIKNTGTLAITGTVSGNTSGGSGQTINIQTKGNLTMGESGKVQSSGSAPVYLVAKDGHFINKNSGAATDVINTPGSRWVIFTEDSIGDSYGNLTGDFRRYGTEFEDVGLLTGSYNGSGTAHQIRPVATIYGEKVYGDGNGQFFTNGNFAVTIADWANRQALDQAFIGGMTTDQANSSKYTMGGGINTGTNVNNFAGGVAYGTGNTDAALQASYTGANPLNYDVQVKLWVTPKEVTVTAGNASKVYDGKVYSGGNGVSYSGFVNGQDKTTAGISGDVNYKGTSQVAKNVGNYGIDITDSDLSAGNYTFKYVNGNLTITPRDITITADNATRVYGAANPTVAGGKLTGGTSLGDGDSIGSVNVAIDGTTATPTANAGTTHNINVNGITFAEGSESNYNITYTPGTLTITKRPVTITADNKERIYGENNPAAGDLTYTIGEKTVDTGLVNGDSIDAVADKSIANSATITANAGTKHDIIMDNAHFIGNAANYDVTYVKGNLTINPRSVLITAGNTNRVYGDANASFGGFTAEKGITGSGRGLLGTDDVASVINGYKDTMTPYTNAGTYTGVITPESHVFTSGVAAGNYIVEYASGNLTITPRPITIGVEDATRVYGAANPTGVNSHLTNGNLANGDTIGNVNVLVDPSATPTANAGTTHNINVNGITFAEGSESNYNITYEAGTLTITKRPVTITADNKERIYGENNPAAGDLTYKIGEATADTGLVNGDSIDAVADKSIASSATTTANAGTKHDIIMDNAHFIGNAANYDVTYVKGNLTITPRSVLITAGNTNRVYGDTNASFGGFTAEKGITGSGRGLLGTDDVSSVINGYKDTMTPYTNAGTYKGVIAPESHIFTSGVTAGNYIVEYASGDLTITPRPVLITAGNTSRVYGDANASFSDFTAEKGTIGSGRGLIGTDDVTSVINGYKDTMNPYTNVGTYTGVITPESHVFAPGVTAGNYSVDYVSGDLTITKAPLHITADNQRRPQNAKNPEFTVQYEGFKNGEKAEDVVTDLTITTPAEKISPAGTYDIVADSGKATNYEISYTPGELLVYPVGAIEDVKTVTQPKTPAGSITVGVPDAANPGQLPVLPDPGAVPPVNTGAVPGLPAGTNGQVSIQSGGSTGERVFVSDGDGFSLQLKTPYIGSDNEIAGEHRTSGAIPVLYASSNNQKLDGIYTINYNPDKLSILPSVQSVTIPRLEEVIPTMNRDFSIIYKTDATGSFEVAFGNGIVSIHPLDQLAVTTVTGPQKEAAKAVFATGILTAVEELGVMPDQVRAVYIFTEIQ